ncbi:MAG: tetratricopeptide repeat protein [Lachnospirales bacterium]
MKCLKCNNTLPPNLICLNCNFNNNTANYIDTLSNGYYNTALRQTRDKDLTNAILNLKKSIELNAKNYTALNLLGLCYYNVGIISEASICWLLSSFYKDHDNIGMAYLNKVETNLTQRERFNDSIKKYNLALESINKGSVDISIISLKKAIELTPNFLEAKNLLAVIYLMNENNSSAVKLLKEILAIDSSNTKALSLLSKINTSEIKVVKTVERKQETPTFKAPVQVDFKPRVNWVVTALSFLAGAGIVSLFLFFLILPGMEKSYKVSLEEALTKSQEIETNYKNELDFANEKNETLLNDIDKVTQEYNNLLYDYSLIEARDLFKKGEALYRSRQYTEAMEIFDKINSYYLEPEYLDSYNAILPDLYYRSGTAYYKQGASEYRSKAYEDSIITLEKALNYTNKYEELSGAISNTSDDILYYLGRSYEDVGNVDKAKKCYEDINTKYPDSNYVSKASQRLEGLNNV